MKRIAIFASGSGTNAENIFNYFKDKSLASVSLILTNNFNAGVIERANRLQVPVRVFSRDEFYTNDTIDNLLISEKIDLVVLAGFLWLIPTHLIDSFPNRIINIHPALLPKYGGKGMYGMRVHEEIVKNNEAETGITVHYVNDKYDEGQIIFQAKCAVSANDSPEDVAERIHKLEYEHFPRVIEKLLS